MLEKDQDYNTIQAMLKYGGDFVYHLAVAASHADANNYSKLKSTFPEYWKQYEEMAKKDKQDETSVQGSSN